MKKNSNRYYFIVCKFLRNFRDRSRTPAISNMEFFVTIVIDFPPMTVLTKRSIVEIAKLVEITELLKLSLMQQPRLFQNATYTLLTQTDFLLLVYYRPFLKG